MRFHDFLHQVQAQSRAVHLIFDGPTASEEWIKHVFPFFFRDAGPAVEYTKLDCRARLAGDGGHKYADPVVALCPILHSVVEQILDRVLQRYAIGQHERQAWLDLFFYDQLRAVRSGHARVETIFDQFSHWHQFAFSNHAAGFCVAVLELALREPRASRFRPESICHSAQLAPNYRPACREG